ncbi:MAG: hypothetical protein R3F62_25275 [Planctomycetota bacterium]
MERPLLPGQLDPAAQQALPRAEHAHALGALAQPGLHAPRAGDRARVEQRPGVAGAALVELEGGELEQRRALGAAIAGGLRAATHTLQVAAGAVGVALAREDLAHEQPRAQLELLLPGASGEAQGALGQALGGGQVAQGAQDRGLGDQRAAARGGAPDLLCQLPGPHALGQALGIQPLAPVQLDQRAQGPELALAGADLALDLEGLLQVGQRAAGVAEVEEHRAQGGARGRGALALAELDPGQEPAAQGLRGLAQRARRVAEPAQGVQRLGQGPRVAELFRHPHPAQERLAGLRRVADPPRRAGEHDRGQGLPAQVAGLARDVAGLGGGGGRAPGVEPREGDPGGGEEHVHRHGLGGDPRRQRARGADQLLRFCQVAVGEGGVRLAHQEPHPQRGDVLGVPGAAHELEPELALAGDPAQVAGRRVDPRRGEGRAGGGDRLVLLVPGELELLEGGLGLTERGVAARGQERELGGGLVGGAGLGHGVERLAPAPGAVERAGLVRAPLGLEGRLHVGQASAELGGMGVARDRLEVRDRRGPELAHELGVGAGRGTEGGEPHALQELGRGRDRRVALAEDHAQPARAGGDGVGVELAAPAAGHVLAQEVALLGAAHHGAPGDEGAQRAAQLGVAEPDHRRHERELAGAPEDREGLGDGALGEVVDRQQGTRVHHRTGDPRLERRGGHLLAGGGELAQGLALEGAQVQGAHEASAGELSAVGGGRQDQERRLPGRGGVEGPARVGPASRDPGPAGDRLGQRAGHGRGLVEVVEHEQQRARGRREEQRLTQGQERALGLALGVGELGRTLRALAPQRPAEELAHVPAGGVGRGVGVEAEGLLAHDPVQERA